MSRTRWERWAGCAGLVVFGAILATFFLPSTPEIGVPDAELASALESDFRGFAANVYLLGIAAAAFLVFAAGLASRLRSSEGEQAGLSVLVVAGGVVFSILMLVASGVTFALATAGREQRDPAALRALFELDEVVFLPAAFGLAVFLLAAGAGIVAGRSLPAWLGWSAVALGAGYLVGALGLLSTDDDGGPLGIVYFLDLLLTMLWIVGASVALLRPHPRASVARRVATPLV
jgi:hypothetical protein